MSDPFRFRRAVEVRFRDIDEMGHAHHTLPLIYIEEARSAYWRDVLGRPELDFIMGEVGIRFLRRILYPSTVSVGVRTTRLGERSLHMEYEIRDEAGRLLAEGWSKLVMYDYAAGESRPLPEAMRERVAEYEPDYSAERRTPRSSSSSPPARTVPSTIRGVSGAGSSSSS